MTLIKSTLSEQGELNALIWWKVQDPLYPHFLLGLLIDEEEQKVATWECCHIQKAPDHILTNGGYNVVYQTEKPKYNNLEQYSDFVTNNLLYTV